MLSELEKYKERVSELSRRSEDATRAYEQEKRVSGALFNIAKHHYTTIAPFQALLPPVFNHLQFASMEEEGLEDLVTCVVTSGGLTGSSDQQRSPL